MHDVNANPFKFTSQTSGYVTPATMEWLGGSSLVQLYVTLVTERPHTPMQAHVRAVAEQVADQIRQSGREVYNINVYQPRAAPGPVDHRRRAGA